MQILAIDLGKLKSVACDYGTSGPEYTLTTIAITPQAMRDLFAERSPDRVVIETGSAAGWIRDLFEAMELDVQIANPNHKAADVIGGKRVHIRSHPPSHCQTARCRHTPLSGIVHASPRLRPSREYHSRLYAAVGAEKSS